MSLGCAAAVAALWTWQDTARSDDEDVAVGELLLELAGEAEMALVEAKVKMNQTHEELPLLRAMPTLE